MENPGSLWNFVPVMAAIVVTAVIVFVVMLVVRSRRSALPKPEAQPQAPTSETDEDLLDSSHIGFAPLVGSVSLPSRDRASNGG